MSLSPRPAACPACAGAPLAEEIAARTPMHVDQKIQLSLPDIHCAGCISGVERALGAVPGISDARVNLTLKRVDMMADAKIATSDLINVLAAKGFKAHELDSGVLNETGEDRVTRDLLMRLAVAGFAMMNVMLLSVAVWSGATDATRDLFHWISAAIALPTVAFAAQPFFRHAMSALWAGRLNMDVPISLAIILASGMSVYETMQSGEHAYFDAALSLTFFLLAGRYLDQRSRFAARSAARELTALEVPRATRLIDGIEETVPIAQIAVGDLIAVKPGGRVPVDGVIADGDSQMNRSLLTGESVPVNASVGAKVSTGEINMSSPLIIRATAVGEDSSLARMAALVALAENAKSRYTSLADRAAAIYAPGVHLLALIAGIGWLWASDDARLALNIAVAVLIITCPCALGLAVPAVSTAASGRLFRHGLLVKNATALERLAEVDTVVFDKTGTLTQGRPHAIQLDDHAPDHLQIAYALGQGSSHPIAKTLADDIAVRGVVAAPLQGLCERPGLGVEAHWNGVTVRLGGADWVGVKPVKTTATYLSFDGKHVATFELQDTLRRDAAEAIHALKGRGLHVALLSGDVASSTENIATQLGIEDWQASVLPAEKASYIENLRDVGRKVLMVGDGLNDTVALTVAHVSISPASALDAARVASDMVLLGEKLIAVDRAIATARVARTRIKQNFGIAAGYNAVAIPIALAGFATPLMAALAMSASSICVSLNALRLR